MPPALKPLKWYKKLSTRKGRLEVGAFLVEGDRAVSQVITAYPEAILEILTTGEPPREYRSFNIRQLNESQFHSVSSVRTPQGLLAVVKSPAGIYTDRLPEKTGDKILLLEDIQDPGNAGTLVRTAAAFGFSGIIMTENCADPLSPKCVQATAGSVLSVWIRRMPEYLEMAKTLRSKGYMLIAADLNGTEDPDVLTRPDRLVLALGNEAVGLSGELLDMAVHRVRIPTVREKAESLNVAACGAICMYLASQ